MRLHRGIITFSASSFRFFPFFTVNDGSKNRGINFPPLPPCPTIPLEGEGEARKSRQEFSSASSREMEIHRAATLNDTLLLVACGVSRKNLVEWQSRSTLDCEIIFGLSFNENVPFTFLPLSSPLSWRGRKFSPPPKIP